MIQGSLAHKYVVLLSYCTSFGNNQQVSLLCCLFNDFENGDEDDRRSTAGGVIKYGISTALLRPYSACSADKEVSSDRTFARVCAVGNGFTV